MTLTKEEFKAWLDEDINYLYSDKVPIEDIFNSITKGQMCKFWKHLVRNVRSQNVVHHIRANLQLEKHRREIIRGHNVTSSSSYGFDHTFEENEELSLEELKKDYLKCDRRLKRFHLELATVEHETVGSQRTAFQLLKTLKTDEAEIRDQTRSAIVMDREAEKYSGWIRELNAECARLSAWTDFITGISLNSSSLPIDKVCKDLKLKLVDIIQDEPKYSSSHEMSDFSNLLDSLKQFPLSECILALIGSLRDLGMKIDAELNVVEGSSLGRRHLRDKVTESMIGLWRRHVESHVASQKIGSEIEKWSERSDKALGILESSLSGENKNLMSHYFKLIRLTSCSEALLVELRSQVANLQVDSTQCQKQTLSQIEQDFAAVKNQSNVLERKRLLAETMLAQATGLSQRVAVFQDLIENTKSNLMSSFLNDSSSSSLISSLSRSVNLPLSFLSSFDETGFRPKVVLESNKPVPCQELTIYRLSTTYPDLNEVFTNLEVFYPANPEKILQTLVEFKTQRHMSENRLSAARRLLELFQTTEHSRYNLSKSETLQMFLEKMKESREKLMLTHHAPIHGQDEWDSVCRRLSLEIEHWKNEPVKEIVKQDDRFVNNAQVVKPLSKWYQEFYSTN